MKKNLFKLGALAMMLSAVIACGPGEKRSAKLTDIDQSLFPIEYKSEKDAIEGGTLKVAVVSDQPFKGVFNKALYQDNLDSRFLEYIQPDVFALDSDFNIIDGGLANMKLDVENKVIDVTIQKDLKWEDGTPVTADDYIFYYEIIAHKDYTGVRYDDSSRNVVGIDEYHEGKADKISGLEKVNDKELKIHVKEVVPEILTGAGGLVSGFMPKKYFEGVKIANMESDAKSRLKPLSYGPYKITQIIPGESVEYAPNEYWYNKETMPKVEKLIVKILPSSSLVSSIKIGEFDIYRDTSGDVYKEYKDFDNISTLGNQAAYYFYLGFNLGHWDENKKENVTDPDKKMSDINLRKAMAYSLDLDQIGKQFYGGLRERANGIIPPVFKKYYNPEKKYSYDPEMAKKILDEAGYKDVDGDGIREDKEGKPLKIEFAFPTYDIAEPLSQKFIQDWEAIGLKVELVGGRLMGNNFFPVVQSNEGYDIYVAAWNVGSNLDFSGLYGKTAKFNMSRIVDEKLETIMKESKSLKALEDSEYRLSKVKEVNDYYMENVIGFLPLLYKYELIPVNKRVKQYSMSNDSREIQYSHALTQKEELSATTK